jgi:hypothetical protein
VKPLCTQGDGPVQGSHLLEWRGERRGSHGGFLEAMRGKAVWPSARRYFAPVEVAASLALVAMVVVFALVMLRIDGHHPQLPTNPTTGGVVAAPSASDPPVLPSPSPQPSPVAQPVTPPATNPPTSTNPVAGVGTQPPTATARPTARPSATPIVLPWPLATPTPSLPWPQATPTPSP